MKDGRTAEHPGHANALSRDAEELVRAAQAHAERLCELALGLPPPPGAGHPQPQVRPSRDDGGQDRRPAWARRPRSW